MDRDELKLYLDYKFQEYNTPKFIDSDPIQLPHRFDKKEDVEIVAFLVSTIAWGKREMIIRSGERLINIMQNEPFEFVQNYTTKDLDFVHRTFNASDLDFFFRSLQHIYATGGLEKAFSDAPRKDAYTMINHFRQRFMETDHQGRAEKHISSPARNSAAKRINMFLRWMVRNDGVGVDFGIWDSIPASALSIPLDVHTATISRELGLLKRKQNDWKALEEIMQILRKFDPEDPSKYDYALFGIGVFEGGINF